MHIFVATDGTLDTERAAEMVARLHEPGDDVSIITAIAFPRDFLSGVAKATGVREVATFAREAGAGPLSIAGGAKAAERFAESPRQPEHPLGGYFATTAHERTDGLRHALADRGIDAVAAWAATEYQTARTILDLASEYDADILVIGARGQGRFEGPLGSTVTKIARRATMHVVIVK